MDSILLRRFNQHPLTLGKDLSLSLSVCVMVCLLKTQKENRRFSISFAALASFHRTIKGDFIAKNILHPQFP